MESTIATLGIVFANFYGAQPGWKGACTQCTVTFTLCKPNDVNEKLAPMKGSIYNA